MTNQVIDNSAQDAFGRVILWQYDKAKNLVDLVASFKSFYDNSTKYLWDKLATEVNVDNATDFGLSILGSLIGCGRPQGISTELYRKFIKAKLRLAMSNYSIAALNEYLATVFDGAVSVSCNGSKLPTDEGYNPMTINWVIDGNAISNEAAALIASNPDFCFSFPAGVRDGTTVEHVIFGFEGQEKNADTDPTTGGLDDSNFLADFDDTQFIPEEERVIS